MTPPTYRTEIGRRLALTDLEERQLAALAAEGDRSVAAEIRRAIRRHLAAATEIAALEQHRAVA